MKAFALSVVAAVVIAVGAYYGLNALDRSAASVFSSQGNVRL